MTVNTPLGGRRSTMLHLALLLGSAIILAAQPARAWEPRILTDPALQGLYLPDFSFAGYRWGEGEPPRPPVTHHVNDFGAIADDGQDDTRAILDTVAAAHGHDGPAVVAFGPGRFILRAILPIERSHFVLRGAGSDEGGTVIEIPVALKDLRRPPELDELQTYLIDGDKREKKTGHFFSPYSWAGGFIWARVPGKRIFPYLVAYDEPSDVLLEGATGLRGGHELSLPRPLDLEPGARLRLEWYNPEGKGSALIEHLYMSTDLEIGSRHWATPHRPLIFQDVTVSAIEDAQITIKEPLRHDLREEWRTALTRTVLLEEVGIEELRIEFPETLRARHHLEPGYNAIYLTGVTQSWVRDVAVHNADNAILSDDASQSTIEDIRISGRPMHYGIHLGRVSGMLARNLEIEAEAYHTLSFNTFANGSVFSQARIAVDASLDQHRGSNHQNLFDQIRIRTDEAEPLTFSRGGAGYWRPTHGAFNTFWNIEIVFGEGVPEGEPVDLKGDKEGPQARLIGLSANRPFVLDYGPDVYAEGIGRTGIAVPSLHAWQLARRLEAQAR